MSNFPSGIVDSSGKTRFRAALDRAQQGGAPCVGQWLEFPGFTLAKTVASLGSDWVLIDCEHGNISDNDMYLAIGAITSAGSSPIVRVPAGELWLIKRALDAGAHGIMIPMCETREEAAAIVAAMKYPSKRWPQGIRGTGAMFAPANFNQDGRQYLDTANNNVLVIVQIETRKAVENVDDIAATDGVDALFIGPNDLASSMGYFAFDHAKVPEVQEASARILKAAKSAGKFAGHFALNSEVAAQKSKEGFDFMNCGADIVALTTWMTTEMGNLNNLLGSDTRQINGIITNGHANSETRDDKNGVLTAASRHRVENST